jgi:hypothetical protein
MAVSISSRASTAATEYGCNNSILSLVSKFCAWRGSHVVGLHFKWNTLYKVHHYLIFSFPYLFHLSLVYRYSLIQLYVNTSTYVLSLEYAAVIIQNIYKVDSTVQVLTKDTLWDRSGEEFSRWVEAHILGGRLLLKMRPRRATDIASDTRIRSLALIVSIKSKFFYRANWCSCEGII